MNALRAQIVLQQPQPAQPRKHQIRFMHPTKLHPPKRQQLRKTHAAPPPNDTQNTPTQTTTPDHSESPYQPQAPQKLNSAHASHTKTPPRNAHPHAQPPPSPRAILKTHTTPHHTHPHSTRNQRRSNLKQPSQNQIPNMPRTRIHRQPKPPTPLRPRHQIPPTRHPQPRLIHKPTLPHNGRTIPRHPPKCPHKKLRTTM